MRAAFKYFKGCRLTDEQFNVLTGSKAQGVIVWVDFGRRFAFKAGIVGITNGLEREGLVEMEGHPGDRRMNVIWMAKERTDTLRLLGLGYFKNVAQLLSGIAGSDLKKLNSTLEKARSNIKRKFF